MRIRHDFDPLFPVRIGRACIGHIAETVEVNAAGNQHGQQHGNRCKQHLSAAESRAEQSPEQKQSADDRADQREPAERIAAVFFFPFDLRHRDPRVHQKRGDQ